MNQNQKLQQDVQDAKFETGTSVEGFFPYQTTGFQKQRMFNISKLAIKHSQPGGLKPKTQQDGIESQINIQNKSNDLLQKLIQNLSQKQNHRDQNLQQLNSNMNKLVKIFEQKWIQPEKDHERSIYKKQECSIGSSPIVKITQQLNSNSIVNMQEKFLSLANQLQKSIVNCFQKVDQRLKKNGQDSIKYLNKIHSSLLHSKDALQHMQPKFKKIPTDTPLENQYNLQQLLAKACRNIFSIGFNLLKNGQLTINKLKAYCSKEILSVLINQKIRGVEKFDQNLLQRINNFLKNEILPYYCYIYPQTEEKGASIKLSSEIIERNSLQDNRYDLIYLSGTKFKYDENKGNYNSQIMTFLNYVLKLPQTQLKLNQNDDQTIYQSFQIEMEEFFRLVQSKNRKMKMLKFNHKKQSSNKQKASIIDQQKENFIQNEKQKQKVRSYTTFEIGRKISANFNTFTNHEIDSGNLSLKSSAIMRVVTKWCVELWEYFDQSKILHRTNAFRMKDGSQQYMKKFHLKVLNKMLQQQKVKIQKGFKKQMQENIYKFQSQFLEHKIPDQLTNFLSHQAQVGYFATSSMKINEVFLIQYLNKLIHTLNKVSKMFEKFRRVYGEHYNQLKKLDLDGDNEVQFEKILQFIEEKIQGLKDHGQISSKVPELITFRIGDLLRCKCTSKETEILALYKELEKISIQNPEKIKIIRLRNKLNEGNKDILMNLLFHETMVVEMQLAVKSDKTKEIEYSNSFNHFFYEMKRAEFGPISQMCKIWMTYDPLAQFYQKKFEVINSQNIKRGLKIYKQKIIDSEQLKKKQRQLGRQKQKCIEGSFKNNCFYCKSCSYFYSDYTCFSNIKAQSNLCLICRMEKNIENKNQIFQNLLPEVNFHQSIKLENIYFMRELSLTGGALLEIKSRKPKPILFRTILYNNEYYLFEVNFVNNKKKLKLINKFKQTQLTQSFLSYNLIFSSKQIEKLIPELSQEEVENLYFLPQILASAEKKKLETVTLIKKQFSPNFFSQNDMLKKLKWHDVKTLNLSQNKLGKLGLTPALPQLFPNVEFVKIYNNEIQSLDFPQLKKWQNLKFLQISKNSLTDISPITDNLHRLVELNVFSNLIKDLPKSIKNLEQLKILNISYNEIEKIPDELGQLKKLQILHLNGLKIQEIPDSFCKLENLKELYILRNQQLKKISNRFGNLKSLTKLSLNKNNKLQQIPEQLGSLEKLQILNIQNHNNLKTLPNSLCNLQSLHQLTINRNSKILKLPPFFDQLKNLRKLVILQNNSLSQLPIQIGCLINLQSFKVSVYPSTCYAQFKDSLKNTTFNIERLQKDSSDMRLNCNIHTQCPFMTQLVKKLNPTRNNKLEPIQIKRN